MNILDFIKTYWVQIIFVCTLLFGMFKFAIAMIEATKCSLRNDILSIYDRCKDKQEITKYQLESIEYSYIQYKKLKLIKRVTYFTYSKECKTKFMNLQSVIIENFVVKE